MSCPVLLLQKLLHYVRAELSHVDPHAEGYIQMEIPRGIPNARLLDAFS